MYGIFLIWVVGFEEGDRHRRAFSMRSRCVQFIIILV